VAAIVRHTHVMRLVAWNCCEKFATNYIHLRDLNFDVAVIAECGRLEDDALQSRALTSSFVQPVPGSSKHLAVFAQEPWSVTPHPEIPAAPGLLPMAVSGPVTFTLLGFWGVDPTMFGSYTSQLSHVISHVLPLVQGRVVLAGDFNAPIASTLVAHAENVRRLKEHHLVSAYTATRRPDAPLEPTYFHRLREEHPFHIDHVFVPESWATHLQMTVGGYQQWVASRRSDHVPLLVDIDTSATAVTGQAAS